MIARLAAINFRKTGGIFLSGALSVAVGAFVLVFFLGVVAGIQRAIDSSLFSEDSVEAAAAGSDVLDAVSLLSGGDGGGGGTISPATLARVAKIRGVRGAFPRLRFKFPMKMWGGRELFGADNGSDIVGDGIPAALLAGDEAGEGFRDRDAEGSGAACGRDADCAKEECCAMEEGKTAGTCRPPVPFVVSGRLIEIYNKVVAPAHNLQRLPGWMLRKLKGLRLKLTAGASYQGRANRGSPLTTCAEFGGVTDRAVDIGVSVPIEYARRWNLAYADSSTEGRATSVVVTVGGKRDLGRVIEELRRAGLEPLLGWQEEVGFLVSLLNALFALVSCLVIIVAAIGISRSFAAIVVERRREIGLMRAIGASRRVIMGLFLVQGAFVGAAGWAAGVATALAASKVADRLAAGYLPDFPFKPATFFAFEPWMFLAALALALAASLAGAWFPARAAAGNNPLESLR